MRRGIWLSGMCYLLFLFAGMVAPSTAQEEQSHLFLPLLARPRSPDTLSILSIEPGNPTGSLLDIWVLGDDNLTSVTARVGNHTAGMSLEPYECSRGGCIDWWHGKLSMEGLPRDHHRLIIEGIDPLGRVVETERVYFYDQLPHLTIHSPERFDTTSPTLHLHVTCTDDSPGGCHYIEARVQSPPGPDVFITQTQSGVLSQTLSLAPWKGQSVSIFFKATDATGRSTDSFPEALYETSVFVPSDSLQAAAEVPGLILDADATRILYLGELRPRTTWTEAGTLMLYDNLTGETTRIQEKIPLSSKASLFAQGVLFTPDYYSGGSHHLYEWRYGRVHDLGPIVPDTLRVRGEYAGWYTGWQAGSSYLLRDLRTGSNQVVFTPLTLDPCISPWCAPDLAANGDVVYTDPELPRPLFRYRNGASTRITPPDVAWYSAEPRTDGVAIAYLKAYPEPEYRSQLTLLGPSGEIELVVPSELEPAPWVRSFALNNGWVAVATEKGIWIRSPDGSQTATHLSPDSVEQIIDLGPTGATIYDTTFHTYLLRPGPGRQALYLHSTTGRVLWRDAEPLLAIGNAIFAIVE